MLLNHFAPLHDDLRSIGIALDVVDVGRLAPEACDGREGRPGPRLAAAAFDGGHQGRLLAADEGAGAFFDMEMEAEVRAQDILAQQAVFVGLGDGRSSAARWPGDIPRGSRYSPLSAPMA